MVNPLFKQDYSPSALQELRERLLAHKAMDGSSWAKLAREINQGASTLSLWASGKYTGDNQGVATAIDKWFRADAVQMQLLDERPLVPGFQPTPTAQKLHRVLDIARMGEVVIVIGDPGVAKTMALDRYADLNPNAFRVTAAPSNKSMNSMLKAVAASVMGTIPKTSGAFNLTQLIRDRLRGTSSVLIIDEAQHFEEPALEELRAIQDDTRIGLAFFGNRTVMNRIEGNRTAAFAQRFSRVAVRLLIEAPEIEDIDMLLDAWGVGSAAQRAALTDIALRPGGGALRTMTQVLKFAVTLARGRTDQTLTLDDIEDARAQRDHRPGMVA